MKINKGSDLAARQALGFELPRSVAARKASWGTRRIFPKKIPLRVWPGPQWNSFSTADHDLFLNQDWRISSESDRVGYRLNGPRLRPQPAEIVSEPVRIGSIQVPESGQPIITMRDGPTVGGYPKIAVLDDGELAWAAQTAPGQSVRFELVKMDDELRPEL